MFVDASVIVAILTKEESAPVCLAVLNAGGSGRRMTNVLAVWEAATALLRKKKIPVLEANKAIAEFFAAAEIQVLGIDDTHRETALSAYQKYGRHNCADAERNRALNMADCFHYAIARALDVPMLSLDTGFAATDLKIVPLV